jgi:D-glycero-D-manno-heptose 1,7-bisphosphate phosphatase
VDQLELLPRAAEAVATLNRAGWEAVVVTNQALVGRGLLSLADLEHIHARLRSLLAEAGGTIRAIYVCPHTPHDDCDCRKPRPGLIMRAAADLRLALAQTFFVGDDLRDVEAARRAGCRPVLVRTGKGGSVAPPAATPTFADVAAFVTWLTTEASS